MTIQERLQIIGRGIRGKAQETPVKEVIKEVRTKTKNVLGGFLDFQSPILSDETKISTKLLAANKGWVYRNNDVIAKEVSGIEFELYTVKLVAGEIVYTPVVQHPILDILDKFNEFTTATDGFYTTQSHRKLSGDCFWYIEGNGQNIKNIFILPPDKVEIILGKDSGANRIIEGYKYEDTIKGKPVKITYRPEQIIHFKVPNPRNLYRGLGAVEAAADAIDTDNMAIEANKKLFERGLISNFLLTTDKSMTDEQLKRMHSEFQRSYGGVKNAFRVPILSGGVKPENIQMTNRDMEFIAQQTWVRDKITSIFGNTKAVIGVTDDVNRANAEATIMHWKRTTIRSEMKGITDTLNEFLVPRFGTNLLLGFCDPVGEDEAVETELAIKKKNAGIISLNEAREDLGLDPVDGGDEFAFQREERLGAEVLPKALLNINHKRFLRRTGVLKEKALYEAKLKQRAVTKALVKPIAQKLIASRTKTTPVESLIPPIYEWKSDKIKQYYHTQQDIIDNQEKVLKNKVEQFVNDMVEKALSEVPEEVTQMQNKAIVNETELLEKAMIDFNPILLATANEAGKEAIRLLGLESTYNPADITKTVEERVKLFSQSLIETDKNKLIDIISGGVSAGQSVPDIRRNITDAFSTYSKSQAERISRTEVSRASTTAALDAWNQTGIVVGKQWVTAGATDECAKYEGKIVADLEKGFFTSSNEFQDGDPPIHPNCKCALIPIEINENPGKDLWSDESGFINIKDGDLDETLTLYRGEGGDYAAVNRNGTNFFGDAFYVARTKKQAKLFGETVHKYEDINLPESLIYKIVSNDQYDALVKSAQKYALAKGRNIGTDKAIPAYIRSLGFKAAEAAESIDPMAGLAVFDPKIKKLLKQLTLDMTKSAELAQLEKEIEMKNNENQKAMQTIKELKDEIKELEEFLNE